MKRAILWLLAAPLVACSAGQPAKPFVNYDLGMTSRAADPGAIRVSLSVPQAHAPAWLDSTYIHYRLAYADASRYEAYSGARWVAPPATMFVHRLRNRLAAMSTAGVVADGLGARAEYVVRLELEEFSQVFDSENSSRAVLGVRASVVRAADQALIAQRVIELERAAPSADAQGAVRGLSDACDEAIEQITGWVAGLPALENTP